MSLRAESPAGDPPYSYAVHGLHVVSELPCPELRAAAPTGQADVSIRLAPLPETIDDPVHVTHRAQIGRGIFQMHAPGVARYRAEAGRVITVDPYPGATADDVRAYLLGTMLGAIVHQSGRLPLHASVIDIGSAAVGFCARSGAGKSTLALAMRRRGYSVMCDDVGVVAITDRGPPLVHPGIPRIRLLQDTVRHFADEIGPLARSACRDEKYPLPTDAAAGGDPVPLAALYVLERADAGAPGAVIEASKTESVALLIEHTYRRKMVHWMERAPEHFQQCAAVARSVRVFRYRRPWHLGKLDASLDEMLHSIPAPAGTMEPQAKEPRTFATLGASSDCP